MFSSNSRGKCRFLIGPGRTALLLTAGVTLLAVAVAKAASPQFVVTQCGVVLDIPGATYELQEDLTCVNVVFQDAALTIVGDGIHLNLNGHTLRGGQSGSNPGVLVQSHNVMITQGAISEFASSVRTEPVAQFTMKNVTLDGSVTLQGQSHTLKESSVITGQLGIVGTDHVVKGNTLSFVVVASCTVASCGHLLDTSNIGIVGNSMPRLTIHAGVDSVIVRDNVVANNTGINVCGNNHLISNNTITLPMRRSFGIRVGDGCAANAVVIKNNTLKAPPGGAGILLDSGTTDAFVTRNTALEFFLWDLMDDSPNCGSNIWKRNTFVTANQSCIQ